jgi:REP-associated tyrosine transposase
MSKFDYKEFYRTNLPHYQPEGVIFAITFRLAFTLPQSILEKLKNEKLEYNRKSLLLTGNDKINYELEFNRKCFEDFDYFIDRYQSGRNWLSKSELAGIVYDSLLFLNHKKYILHCFTIMPNHVHLIIKPMKNNESYHAIADILRSLKGFTARQCNKILHQKGQFWQHGHYDHAIRNDNDYNYQVNYVKNNPVKAGLVKYWDDWDYTYINQTLP